MSHHRLTKNIFNSHVVIPGQKGENSLMYLRDCVIQEIRNKMFLMYTVKTVNLWSKQKLLNHCYNLGPYVKYILDKRQRSLCAQL